MPKEDPKPKTEDLLIEVIEQLKVIADKLDAIDNKTKGVSSCGTSK